MDISPAAIKNRTAALVAMMVAAGFSREYAVSTIQLYKRGDQSACLYVIGLLSGLAEIEGCDKKGK